MDILAHKEWTFWSLLCLALGIYAITTNGAYVYGKYEGVYRVSKLDDLGLYWTFTIMYFNASLFTLIFAAQEYYPYKLWKLMYLGKGNKVRPTQIVFYVCIIGLWFASTFFIADIVINA